MTKWSFCNLLEVADRLFKTLLFAATIIFFVSCQCDDVKNPDIPTKEWRLTYLSSAEIGQVTNRPILEIEGQKVHGFGGCNRYFGGVNIARDTIDFLQIASTKMACFDDIVESKYFAMLEKAAKYRLENDKLMILDTNNTLLATFE